MVNEDEEFVERSKLAEILSSIEHGTRNLSSQIVATSKLAGKKTDIEEIKKDLKHISNLGLLMEDEATGSLILSQIISGEYSFKGGKSDIGLVAEEIKNRYIGFGREQEVSIENNVPYPGRKTKMKQGALKMVYINLIRNALDHCSEGHRVSMGIEPEVNEEFYECNVWDNGPGIEEEDRERIFDLFETGKEDGTGIGLSAVKRIIERYGGEMWVESETGYESYSDFRFTVPSLSANIERQ